MGDDNIFFSAVKCHSAEYLKQNFTIPVAKSAIGANEKSKRHMLDALSYRATFGCFPRAFRIITFYKYYSKWKAPPGEVTSNYYF